MSDTVEGGCSRPSGGERLDPGHLLYRWDLDKTYLRTEFDSLRDLLRTAFEPARRKRTVPGAAVLLRELQGTGPAGIFVLSGSPESMRRVLERKLRLDGVRWDELVLKPSLRKLLQGDLRFLRDQLGYKLGALLRGRAATPPVTREVLFGDDAEQDAFVYSLYADLCARRVTLQELARVLRAARVDEERHLPALLEAAAALPRAEAVLRIFIHLDRLSGPDRFDEFGTRLCAFFNYFQPAAVLVEEGVLGAASALRVGLELVEQEGFRAQTLGASLRDLLVRGHIGAVGIERLLSAAEQPDVAERRLFGDVLRPFAREARRLLEDAPPRACVTLPTRPYHELYDQERARWRLAKARARSARM